MKLEKNNNFALCSGLRGEGKDRYIPEHLHFGAQLCHTVMMRLVNGEKGVAAAVRTLPAAEVTFRQVSLQAPPLYLHRTT